ncbi:HD domain-containing protein [Clostridium chauvoei]|uniref:HD domain-containing protein n=2 Tax=Clostridium chauvoei TaxID=46867 RepID=A0ABD4RHB1_9CLOT|nr:HD domain-containing protein [Clostridium chauvoei]ATD55471.1 hypothetical protein BTM20_09590 [Clostridium chauvoei]ATD56857.1 hypothetical protein BTM21_03445 [Clostridium chauvoei]MBX7280686.1 HD domain-containing protein [Clostridium chauvoei]MBX7283170.1 HD domain-containing protein [Clostridium chauvoei]MBX7285727.1 HD domain-containing protein [Clostridium chauvoei]
MERLNKILNSKEYKGYIKKLEGYEKDREFCKHDFNHFTDLARIAYIKVLERGLLYDKEIIYTIAFLHDIGRVLQYESNIPHHEGSAIIAKELLEKNNFSNDEIELILKCIINHRKDSESELEKIIYECDKLSRNCFSCKAISNCYWDENKKNKLIKY